MSSSTIQLLAELMATGENARSEEEKLQIAAAIRASSAEASAQLDRYLIREHARLRESVEEAAQAQNELRCLADKLLATPWILGTVGGAVATSMGPRALVGDGSVQRIVDLADGLDMEALGEGDRVFLTGALNLVTEKCETALPGTGEIAEFVRHETEGRIVLSCRDDRFVVNTAASLRDVELEPGDQVRWDKSLGMAFERMTKDDSALFMGEYPDETPDQVGGQDGNLERLLSALTAVLADPEKAREYGLDGRQSLLMIGPPGCGKTLMARVAAAEISRMTGRQCWFSVVKPGEWEDPFVGVTQAKIRRHFAALAEASERGPAVLFLDEIESIGRIRGHSFSGYHSDKFLAALLAEIDGFSGRGGVAVVAATNRKDLVDPALLERLSGIEVEVRRPDMRGAESIFDIHMPPTVPYRQDGKPEEAVRRDLIRQGVSLVYSPNSDSDLCTIKFRDGTTRTVSARELASGRLFAQVCQAARQAAFLRDVRGGARGVGPDDMARAVADAMLRLRSTLTAANCHTYLPDLPQDLDVVSVEPVVRKSSSARAFVELEVA